MTNNYWAPNRVENRSYQVFGSTLHNLPAAGSRCNTTIWSNEPLKEIKSYSYLCELLNAQISIAEEFRYPLCLAVGELRFHGTCDADLLEIAYAVVRCFSLRLRPNDIILRYTDKRFAVLLPGATEYGGTRSIMRISECLSEELVVVGRKYYHLQPVFGYAAMPVGHFRTADNMIRAAEAEVAQLIDPLARFERVFV